MMTLGSAWFCECGWNIITTKQRHPSNTLQTQLQLNLTQYISFLFTTGDELNLVSYGEVGFKIRTWHQTSVGNRSRIQRFVLLFFVFFFNITVPGFHTFWVHIYVSCHHFPRLNDLYLFEINKLDYKIQMLNS